MNHPVRDSSHNNNSSVLIKIVSKKIRNPENVEKVVKNWKNPHFKSSYLFFTYLHVCLQKLLALLSYRGSELNSKADRNETF